MGVYALVVARDPQTTNLNTIFAFNSDSKTRWSQEGLDDVDNFVEPEVLDQWFKRASVLLDYFSDLFRLPNMRLGTGKYRTVGEEDAPFVCWWVNHWQNLETDGCDFEGNTNVAK